ncbi:MAG: hypothetical protein KDJ35_02340 [Alphaproteobacteria bacterium]|nr:hypothetical protein [Alphaproteobacteria bacterium]
MMRPHFFLLFLSVLILPLHLYAADENALTGYISQTGIYQLKIPDTVKTQTETLRLGADTVLSAEQLSAVIDNKPYKNAVKHYIVQLEQTMGPELSQDDVNHLIDLELDTYIAYYKSKNAALKNREKKYYGQNPGGEIYMTYEDDEMGTQSLRARVLYSDFSKVLQIVTAPDESAFSLQAQSFFDSLTLKNGTLREGGNIIDDWAEYNSPMNSFSVLLPPHSPPYIAKEPTITHESSVESITQIITDPVRHEKINYKISSYNTGKPVTVSAAQYVMLKHHASKYLNNPKGVQFTTTTSPEGHTILDATFAVKDEESPKEVNAIKLRGTFSGNIVMVQELMTSKTLMESELVTNLLGHVLFHPETYGQERSISEPPTPEAPSEP